MMIPEWRLSATSLCGRVALGVNAGRRVERVSKIRSMETVWALETLRVAALLLPCSPSSPWQKCRDCPELTSKPFRIDRRFSPTGVLPQAASQEERLNRSGLHSLRTEHLHTEPAGIADGLKRGCRSR